MTTAASALVALLLALDAVAVALSLLGFCEIDCGFYEAVGRKSCRKMCFPDFSASSLFFITRVFIK